MRTNSATSRRCIAGARETKARALYVGLCALGIALAASAGTPNMQFITFNVSQAGNSLFQGTSCGFLFYFSHDCSVVLNDLGAVTGYYVDSNYVSHGFLRSPDGTITTFDAPDADTSGSSFLSGTFPSGINDAGGITGSYIDTSGAQHGFLRSPDGKFYEEPIDPPGSTFTIGFALNLEGSVVGSYYGQNGFESFLRYPDGSFATWVGPGQCVPSSPIPCYGGGALNINVFGTVSGSYEDSSGVTHGLVRSPVGDLIPYSVTGAATSPLAANGTYYPQGTSCPACATPINLWGAIAGYYADSSYVAHGYLRSPDGSVTPFDLPNDALQGPGLLSDLDIGLNDFGAITGYYLDTNLVVRGFLRAPDGRMIAFDAPGAGSSLLYGAFLEGTFPLSINDAGVIAGYYVDANGASHGFLLLPPEGGW